MFGLCFNKQWAIFTLLKLLVAVVKNLKDNLNWITGKILKDGTVSSSST